MKHKFPQWVWIGGGLLSLVGGMVNIVTLLSFTHESVSHVSGSVSEISISLGRLRQSAILPEIIGIVLLFFLGGVACGWFMQSSTLQLGRKYGTALWLETALLCIAIVFLQKHSTLGIYICAFACGLQNAMANHYSGAIVRTTHITGIVTDLGNEIGQYLRGLSIDHQHLYLCVLIISGYTAGGVVAAMLYPHWHALTLLVPAVITGSLAVRYDIYRLRRAEVTTEPRS